MAPDPRVVKAFGAMKSLGIPCETVKPVLKKLLKLYDSNWELIEDDNYRTLADAIFECADDKLREDKKRDVLEYDELEPPYKKPHLEQQEDQVSGTRDNASTEEVEIPQVSNLPGMKGTPQSCLIGRRTESSSYLYQAPFCNKGKDPVSLHSGYRDRKLSYERASNAFYTNQAVALPASTDIRTNGMPGNGHDEDVVKPKMMKPINNSPQVVVPTSMTHSGSSTGNSSSKHLMSQHVDSNERKFDIASSSSSFGKVKISLNCDSVLGQPNFQTPNWNSVLKFVEDKYLRSYKIVGPEFSVMKLLKELCEVYLELGARSNNRSAVEGSSDGDYLCNNAGPNRESERASNVEMDLTTKEFNCSSTSSSLNLVVAPRHSNAGYKKRSFRKIGDITRGTEKVRISLLDEVGNEHLPNFVYVPHNIIFQNAFVHVSLARIADEDCCSNCVGDCLSSSVPCACARDTGGDFAYTPQGLLTEEFLRSCISMNQEPQKHYSFYCQDCPLERAKNAFAPESCKGHLVRRFIKECWRKCGCNMQCGNRIVQRGITRNLQVFLTNDSKGWGLRTLENLPIGAFVCEYVGEILTNMELYERNNGRNGNDRHTYPVLLDADWGSEQILKDEDALCLDATNYGNVARFINHRCFDANLLEIPVEVETPDHHYYHIAFFTKRKVEALEELTWDYGIDFNDHNHPIKAFQCRCRSPFCRDVNKKAGR